MQGGRVLIADDHPVVVEALALAVGISLPELVVDRANSVAEAEAIVARFGGYRLVLLDLMLPDARGFSGFLRLQQALGPTVPILIVTAQPSPEVTRTATDLGAAGVLSKGQPLDELARAMRWAIEGRRAPAPAPSRVEPVTAASERLDALSDAQRRVLLLLSDGRSNKQIAGSLNVTEATVKAHLTAIFRKLRVQNRAQALLAMQPLLGALAGRASQ